MEEGAERQSVGKTEEQDSLRCLQKQARRPRVPNDQEGRTWAELIAEAQVRDAVRGNVQAAREIADRTEGRARQAIEFEDTTLAKAFERMTREELEAYARDGSLPAWFPRDQRHGAAGNHGSSTDD